MDPFDEMLIKKYLNLDKRIINILLYRKRLQEEFYSQNMATHLVYDAHGIHSEGFRQDRKVLDYLETLDVVDKRIERLKIRKKYFDQYLDSLDIDDFQLLNSKISKLTEKVINNVLDEIDQIEAAVCLREGIEVNEIIERVTLTNDFEENINLLSDLFVI